ncbi:S1 family peptidase [Streptosporangium roseum]|uniref:Streptogrisin C n=1 Tax=Streptosporangium roseum (strain ATCC 12428 / DSM 43021 / JCM 3005 / KCTC 9067 / NCIMB 10171 / NRRL 2505 / NI 9100) TaxID=479432 RepID=D2B7M7_STRRD|nr:S1 family peptidase [Streptosporangium roseum]ACZ91548.1 streptogrisin C [Streptosporangium roseum DSM 43021]
MSRRHVITTGCVLTITALTLTAAPAVATSPTVNTSVVLSARQPPPGMIEALQRDLGLTREQAQTRLLNEARLRPVEAKLRRRLGDRFGGSWFTGITAQGLVVATTSSADIPQIRAAGARGEVVDRSMAELDATVEEVDAALSTHPNGRVRYVDVKANKVVILSDAPSATRSLIEAAGVDPVAVRVVPSDEQPRPLSDLQGGTPYYIGSTSRCSVGFSVLRGAQNGFVSAGHCGKVGAATVGFNRVAQGVFQASNFPESDFGWVAVNDDWTPKPLVDNGTGGTVTVAGSKEAIEGASVCRSGSTTGWHCGTIQQRNVSVTYPQGTVSEVTRTNVCAEPGDSGGSFIAIDQAQGVTSGGSGDCTSGGVTYFQPIGEILTTYGLSLVTTAGNPPPLSTGTCTGYEQTITGTLSNGQSVYQPNNRHYRSTVAGVHAGCLDADDGVDLDLYLQKWNGRGWDTVATADSPSPDEKISYTGTPGHYRYRVPSSNGSSPYTLGYKAP